MSDRQYPDIQFVDTSTERITEEMVRSYETLTGRTLYKADPIRVLILWMADIIAQERVLINESAKQNVLRYAEGQYLDSLCEIFRDVYRLPASRAATTLRFELSEAREEAVIVPAGTRVTVDGEITFMTVEVSQIDPGDTYVYVHAECLTPGEIGNGFAPGQISTKVDIFPWLKDVTNITLSEGGGEVESDEALYERMRESTDGYSVAGPIGGYEYIAKSASPSIVDAKAISPSAGIVDVYILTKDGLPGQEIKDKVKDALSKKMKRPMSDLVNVKAPDPIYYDIELKYYIDTKDAAMSQNISEAVVKVVEEYKAWQSDKLGRDINPSRLTMLLMQAGVKRIELTAPMYITVEKTQAAVLRNNNVVNGGLE